MFTFLTIGAAWFAFGYCVTDIFQTYQSNKRINELIKDFEDIQK
jgi:hypothetical protein